MAQLALVLQPAVPMRESASDCAEMVSQMLFGDVCEVLETTERWHRVRCCSDNYTGWVNPKQITSATQADLDCIDQHFGIAHDPIVTIAANGAHPLHLPMGARIPLEETTLCNQWLSPTTGAGQLGKDLADYALRLLGSPYLWGGKTLMGIDCSGLVQVAGKPLDIDFPRDASQQALVGMPVASVNDARRNDLMFFANDAGRVIHVGIYLGNNNIVHASGNVHIDKVDDHGIFSQELDRYTHRLHSIRRP